MFNGVCWKTRSEEDKGGPLLIMLHKRQGLENLKSNQKEDCLYF